MQANTGYLVLDRAGEFVAWAAHIEVAFSRMRGDPLAHTVERCSDGVMMAFRQARKKKPGERWFESVAA